MEGGREGGRGGRYLFVGQGALGDEVGRRHGGDHVEDVEVHAEGGAVGALGGREEGKEGGREEGKEGGREEGKEEGWEAFF